MQLLKGHPSSFTKVVLRSMDEAQAFASFPVKLPSTMPPQFRLESFEQWWPGHIDAQGRQRKIHADYVVANYVDPDGRTVQIIQGFTAIYIAWAGPRTPSDSMGSLSINGKRAVWLTAYPKGRDWIRGGFSYVGWQDGIHPAPAGAVGDSPRYYGLASDTFSIAELIPIAESVPSTPWVVIP